MKNADTNAEGLAGGSQAEPGPKTDVKFLTAAAALMMLIIVCLAALWLTERNRRIKAQERPSAGQLELMLKSLSSPGAGAPAASQIEIYVDSSGKVIVCIRADGCDLKLEFASIEQFKASQPGLFEKFQSIIEKHGRPPDEARPGGRDNPATTAPAADGGG